MNFVLTEMTFLRYFIPLIKEGNKRSIKSSVYVGTSHKYNCPQRFVDLLDKESKANNFNIKNISDLKKSNNINFYIEGCGVSFSSKESKKIVLTYQNDFANKESHFRDNKKIADYYNFIDKVDHVIFPSIFFAKYYETMSDKNLYLGSPKYDISFDRNSILQKYGLERDDKYVLAISPKIRDKDKLNLEEIYQQIRNLGYKVIVKARGKDSYKNFKNLHGDNYFEDFCWYPHDTMELIHISDFIINFDSTSNKECVMARKPIINFKIKPERLRGSDSFEFLNNYDYCWQLKKDDITISRLLEGINFITDKNNKTLLSKSFDKAINNHLFNFNSSEKIIDNLFIKKGDKWIEKKKN